MVDGREGRLSPPAFGRKPLKSAVLPTGLRLRPEQLSPTPAWRLKSRPGAIEIGLGFDTSPSPSLVIFGPPLLPSRVGLNREVMFHASLRLIADEKTLDQPAPGNITHTCCRVRAGGTTCDHVRNDPRKIHLRPTVMRRIRSGTRLDQRCQR